MSEDQIKKNRIMLGWAYFIFFLFSGGLLLFSLLAKETFLAMMKIAFVSTMFQIIQIGIIIFVIFRIVKLADSLNRSKLWWALSVFYFIPLLLLFLKSADHPFKFPETSTGFSFSGKTCSQCGRSVPSYSRAGERCPYCNSYWSYEKKGK
jgi:hypothetical protein